MAREKQQDPPLTLGRPLKTAPGKQPQNNLPKQNNSEKNKPE